MRLGGSGAASGIGTVATYTELLAITATGSGAQYFAEERGEVFTDCAITPFDPEEEPSEFWWLPDAEVRDENGDLLTVSWALTDADDLCRLEPGDTLPGSYSVGGAGGPGTGTVTTGGGKISVQGYFIADVKSTGRLLGIATLYAACAAAADGAANNHGVFFGSYHGSTARMIGWRVVDSTTTPRVKAGYYDTTVGVGEAYAKVGEPIFQSVRVDSASAPSVLYDSTAPGRAHVAERSEYSGSARYFEAVALTTVNSTLELSFVGLLKVG